MTVIMQIYRNPRMKEARIEQTEREEQSTDTQSSVPLEDTNDGFYITEV